MEKGATFGLHRLSFTQLAARLAAAQLAANGHAPSSALGYEAVAARAAFEATQGRSARLLLSRFKHSRFSEGARAYVAGTAIGRVSQQDRWRDCFEVDRISPICSIASKR